MLDTVWIPAANGQSRRLLVALHGLGDSPQGFRWLPDAMQLPSMNYVLVQAPDSYYGGFSWYDIYGSPGPGVLRSRRLLFELLEDLEKNKTPAQNITLLGFSQGCLMCLEVAARYPRRLAGIVGISGYVHEPESMIRELASEATRQRILVTHGSQDPTIPIDQARPQFELLQRNGLQIDWREFAKGHTIAGDEEMAVIREFVRAGYEG
jgi:phospholipase/carboxylesterase